MTPMEEKIQAHLDHIMEMTFDLLPQLVRETQETAPDVEIPPRVLGLIEYIEQANNNGGNEE